MTAYYFGTVNYINDDSEFNSQTENNKFFETEDELVQDIVNGGHLAKLMEKIYDGELHEEFEEKLRSMDKNIEKDEDEHSDDEDGYSWYRYFESFPIKNKSELEQFVEQFEGDYSWLDIKFHKIVYGKNKRIREDEEDSSNKKSKNE
jgi:hypothetical protein